MKIKAIVLSLMAVSAINAYASNGYVTIISNDSNTYEIVENYIKEYTEWIEISNICSFDKTIEEVYFNKTYEQKESCQLTEERTVTTKVVQNGVEKTISVEKENKVSEEVNINNIIGTHLEKSCNDIIKNNYETTDGIYTVGVDSDNFEVYCDMNNGTGWTLVGKVNTANKASVAEPKFFFKNGYNSEDIKSPNMIVNGGLSGLGMEKINKLSISNLSKITLIQQFEEKSVDFYKETTLENLDTWFNSSEKTETMTCANEGMSLSCNINKFTNATTYKLNGMNLTHSGYSNTGDIHFRFNESEANYYSSACSHTADIDGNAWGDVLQNHWGNGMLIYLK